MKDDCGPGGDAARRRSDVERILLRATTEKATPVGPASDLVDAMSKRAQCFGDDELPGRAAEPCGETATFELSIYPDKPGAQHRIVSAPVGLDGGSRESLPPMPSLQ